MRVGQSMSKPRGPVLIDLEKSPGKAARKTAKETPMTAPPVPDIAPPLAGKAMQNVVVIATGRTSRLVRWFWRLLGALITFGISIWAWEFVTGLIARNTYLGYGALVLTGLFLLVCFGIILREAAAFARLRRLDEVRRTAETALANQDLTAAREVSDRLMMLYSGREYLKWGRKNLAERQGDVFDADGLLGLAEAELLAPLDSAARLEIEAAARRVATVTAIVPLAFADVVVALTSNLGMIRRIAEIYGGRSGTLGSWRLTRSVLAHLVATGAVAIGDDLIGTIAGGSVLSKLSRRFGEGIINGALTARVGVAAMEVCRPLPFRHEKRPAVTSLVQRALTGLFRSVRT